MLVTLSRWFTAPSRWVLALALLSGSLGGLSAAETPQPAPQRDPAELVRQLGDPEFAVREQVTEQLIGLGITAEKALQAGTQTSDREVRFRSERILKIVRQIDFQRRLQAFAADAQGKQDYALPGWDRYRELIGQDGDARSLFVEMQRAEPELMRAIEEGPQAVNQLFAQRAGQRNQQNAFAAGGWGEVSLGSIAAHLFAVLDEEVKVDTLTSAIVYNHCFDPSFEAAIERGPRSTLLRKLLGAWITRQQPDSLAYQSLMLAMKYDLQEGLTVASHTLRNKNAQANERQYAILTLAKMGNEEHVPLLEGVFDDATPCARDADREREITYETQIRDVALAAALHLLDENPREYGFTRLKGQPLMVFHAGSLGFANEEDREKAFAKWRERKESATEAQPADEASDPEPAATE